MFDKGHAYSTINSAKCTIATIVHIPPYSSLNKHPLINKYMTGVFNLRPPKPKLSFVWDVDILFRYFEQQRENSSLSNRLLTQKLLVLLLLLGAHRISTVKLFGLSNMVLNDLPVTFIPTEVLKHSGKSKPPDKFKYRSYTDKKLCIISCLREYLTRQDKHVELNVNQLIITLKKPFQGASVDTMRRWVKDIFIINNVVDFSPHSCRAASASKSKNMEVNIDETLKRSCWKNRKNFFIYYDKVITEYAPDDIDFKRICQV